MCMLQYMLLFKSLGSIYIFSFKEINTFIKQGCVKRIKGEIKYLYS